MTGGSDGSSSGAAGEGLREVLVGRIGRPHGLRGDLTIDVRTDEPERRFQPGAALRAELPAPGPNRVAPPSGGKAIRLPPTLTVETARWHQGRLLLTFEEIPDRTAAEQARGLLLFVSVPADAIPEDPDEYYDHQLVGLAVVDPAGQPLGTLIRINHGSAQDLLVVRTADGREALVPFVAALVPKVDLEAGQLVVADRPGLIAPFPEE